MRKVLVLQHVEHEGLGIIEGLLKGRGLIPEYVRFYQGERLPGTADGHSALIVLGGPMGVYEEEKYPFLRDEVAFIQKAMKGTPTVGICLGAQLIARAAGAEVMRGGTKEIGWYPLRLTEEGKRDHLLAGIPDELCVFQWHGDTFDIPEGAVNLATSELFPHQAIRVGAMVYGLQFHLEVTGEMVKEWIEVNGDELAMVTDYIHPDSILRETEHFIAPLNRLGKLFFSAFLDLLKK